jgi:RNA polymerase sigma-70 factor (ECF subfamily)
MSDVLHDRGPSRPQHEATALAREVRSHLAAGDQARARERFEALVVLWQRRALRLAWHYLRDTAETDEVVQDAFVRAYTNLLSYQETSPFDVWFGRILVNACLDRIKARARRQRWQVPLADQGGPDGPLDPPAPAATPEDALLEGERAAALREAIDALPDRQRQVVLLSQLEGHTTREVSEVTGLSESTVRVHLFRAMRRLRALLDARRTSTRREGARHA